MVFVCQQVTVIILFLGVFITDEEVLSVLVLVVFVGEQLAVFFVLLFVIGKEVALFLVILLLVGSEEMAFAFFLVIVIGRETERDSLIDAARQHPQSQGRQQRVPGPTIGSHQRALKKSR